METALVTSPGAANRRAYSDVRRPGRLVRPPTHQRMFNQNPRKLHAHCPAGHVTCSGAPQRALTARVACQSAS